MANDWTHANSVSVSAYDGSLIVSIRHLSTVCSFAPPTAAAAERGINWCLSSELPGRSNFSFADEADMFFNQHAALQLANGNLVLFDNGNARVEEGWGGGDMFSRGVEYALSFGSEGQGTASKVWELRVAYDSHQGSVYPLPTTTTTTTTSRSGGSGADRYIVHVPNMDGDRRRRSRRRRLFYGSANGGLSAAYEVDGQGNVLSTLVTRIFSDTAYRAVPLPTINGEQRLASS